MASRRAYITGLLGDSERSIKQSTIIDYSRQKAEAAWLDRLLLGQQQQQRQRISIGVGRYSQRIDTALPGQHTRAIYDALNAKESRILMQLRTGKCRLNRYLHSIRAVETDQCSCGQAAETVDHFLFRRRRWNSEREGMIRYKRTKMGNLSFFLGGKSGSDGEEWKPDMAAVRTTIKFAMATGRLDADR
ncbi:endonuclease/exonuclease/phosphatase [Purpureocillium lavendulum]|uniref:Endonuclease/exonuclease/phosphatase n=1 Tax=Purpureocillium lavendulum TaxID=1247861 RepID=A0AB34FC41_9HYPO|nr:endonuclease/exonuclease/phosphatase [Purpureocillium lavendulum]